MSLRLYKIYIKISIKTFVIFGLFLSACSIGYRKTIRDTSIKNKKGQQLNVKGGSDSSLLMLNADFRFLRFSMPMEMGRGEWEFVAEDGGEKEESTSISRRYYRLDAPVISVYQPDNGFGIWYPGLLERRKSVELWIGSEFDMYVGGHRWVDLGIMYYHYNRIGIRLYGGIGVEGIRMETHAHQRAPIYWKEDALDYGLGIEFTISPGEHFLDFLKFFWAKDQQHQRRLKYKRYGR